MIVLFRIGLVSGLSNTVSATPGEGILLTGAGLDLQGGTFNDTFTYEVTFVYPADPTTYNVVIDGVVEYVDGVTNFVAHRFERWSIDGARSRDFR